MPTSAYNKFNVFGEDLHNAVHNFSSHVFKAMLTNTAPVATNTIKSNLTEISAGNGYAAGGVTITMTPSRSGAITKITAADNSITASGGSVGPFRYLAIYNDTSASDSLMCWLDYGTNQTLLDGEGLNIDFDGTNGLSTYQ